MVGDAYSSRTVGVAYRFEHFPENENSFFAFCDVPGSTGAGRQRVRPCLML
jgi:hypothetical protein